MGNDAYFIRRRGEECSIVKVLPASGEEILEIAEAETLYFICIGEPVYDPTAPDIAADDSRTGRRRARQLAFKF
jgi:hypothetical protein